MSAITGIIGASYVPTDWGLEFTGTLALVALVGPSLNARPAIVGAAAAAVVALIAYPMPFKLGLFCGAIAGIAGRDPRPIAAQQRAPAQSEDA